MTAQAPAEVMIFKMSRSPARGHGEEMMSTETPIQKPLETCKPSEIKFDCDSAASRGHTILTL